MSLSARPSLRPSGVSGGGRSQQSNRRHSCIALRYRAPRASMGLYETRDLVGVRYSGVGSAGLSVRFEHPRCRRMSGPMR